jgi:beta-phosphoglucomutase
VPRAPTSSVPFPAFGVHSTTAGIFDVDGVLLASPHERAWREALVGFADPERFTTAVYQAEAAGKPRLAGAQAILAALGETEVDALAYAARKQSRLVALVDGGFCTAFPDALRLVAGAAARGWPMAVASSSKNANRMMSLIKMDGGAYLLDLFSVNVCGRDLPRGKPDPAIFLLAAEGLGMSPRHCVVFEDSPAGIEAAHAGHMMSVGVARLGDQAGLKAAGAGLVVTSLDDPALAAMVDGKTLLGAA